jgi:hypothetical protein
MELPPFAYNRLLPHPDLSISRLLSFNLPQQLDNSLFGIDQVNIQDFWSEKLPVAVDLDDIETLQQLPIPPPAILDKFRYEITLAPNRHKIKSIIYSHLPTTNPVSSKPFPFWVFEYWVQVSNLRIHVRAPWNRAESWVANQHLSRFPERKHLAHDVRAALDRVPWTGYISGFTDHEPLIKLTRYLSHDWLATTQINQQLDLLRQRVFRQQALSTKYEIVNTHFFSKIIEIFNQIPSAYTTKSPPSGSRHLWTVGQDLANPLSKTTIVCGVLNVMNSHWVSIAVDVELGTISYGDSLGPDGETKQDVTRALKRWITAHIKCEFVDVDLPCTRQTNSHSCGVFAINSIQHLLFPHENLLQPSEAITERYYWFLAALNWHNEVVCPRFPSFLLWLMCCL